MLLVLYLQISIQKIIFSCFVTDGVLLDLVYLFMQEFWTERPIPRQFLSFLLSHSDTGCPVVDSLTLALGGTKVIKKWVQKQDV